jgi:serine/threonine protein kinase/Flp pilus assembly protein TadD
MSSPNPATESIFWKALAIPSAPERAHYLKQACGDDDALRAQVEELVAAHPKAERFLEAPAAAQADTLDQPTRAEGPGSHVGPYKLLQQIGEGGMGVVYMAEQTQPVQRKVALKIIKPGMDSRQVIARFEAERQALALMDHPHIAKVLDAGTTETGRPYFVMELVKGVPITRYCDEHHLTPRERLELFVPVCQAVQHAHQKGIIHRDLKPSNVMVCLYDGKPVPKVIDFGVAKATGPKLTERTMFTELGQVVGTLEYMSPEQAELNQLDVDTRSDIYSLGVLLYELLTGTTPLTRKQMKEKTIFELLRMIREEEPPKPSTRLSTTEELPAIAANRGLEPRKLSGLVRGELDWIVMKALEKDRNRRYETASAFAGDVQRYLADEPVHACPPSGWYRFGKFARRNRTVLTLAACLILVFGSLAGSVGWAVRDRAARDAALDEAVNRAVAEAGTLLADSRWPEAHAVIQRAEALLDSAGRRELPARLQELKQDVAMVQRLEGIYLQTGRNQSLAYPAQDVASFQAFQDHFLADQDQALAFAQAFRDYGLDLAVLPIEAAAERMRVRSIHAELAWALDSLWHETRRRRRPSDPQNPDWQHVLELARKADPDPWRNKLRHALERGDRKGLEALAASADVRRLPPATLHLLGSTLSNLGSPQHAAALMAQAQRQRPEHPWINNTLGYICTYAVNPRQYEVGFACYTAALAVRPYSAALWMHRANARGGLRQWHEAIADYSRSIELNPKNLATWGERGTAYAHLGQWGKALEDYCKAIELDPKNVLTLRYRGVAYNELHQYDKALADLTKAIELDPNNAAVWTNRGRAFHGLRQYDKALADLTKAIELDPNNAAVWNDRGVVYYDLHQYDKALATYSKAIALDPNNAILRNNRGLSYNLSMKWDLAIDDLREALRLRPDYAEAKATLGESYNNLGAHLSNVRSDHAGAVTAFRAAIRLKPNDVVCRFNLGNALRCQGKLGEAEVAYREAILLNSDCAVAHRGLGLILEMQAKTTEALAEYRDAVRLNPNDANFHNHLAWLLATAVDRKLRAPQQAVAAAKRAVQLAPRQSDHWTTLGVAHYRAGTWKEAISALEKSAELTNGDNSCGWFFLAMAQWHLGQKDKARRWYAKAVQWMDQNDQKNEELRRFRAEAEALLTGKQGQ